VGEKLENRIQAIITKLNAALVDAKKFDGGKTGATGTRVRKAAHEIIGDLKSLRLHISAAKNADKPAE
jgi:hypothetical protein